MDIGIPNGSKKHHKSRYYILEDSKSQDRTCDLTDDKQKNIQTESTLQKLNKAYLSILDDAEYMVRYASHMGKKLFEHASTIILQNKVLGKFTSESATAKSTMLQGRQITDKYSIKSTAANKRDEKKGNGVHHVKKGERESVNTANLSYSTPSVISFISIPTDSFMTSESFIFPKLTHSHIVSNGIIPPRRLALFAALRNRFRKRSTRSKKASTLSNQSRLEGTVEQTFYEISQGMNMESTTESINELIKISHSGSREMIETMKQSESYHHETDLKRNSSSTSPSPTLICTIGNDVLFIHNDSLNTPVPITHIPMIKNISKITTLPIERKLQKWLKGDQFSKWLSKKNHLNRNTLSDKFITSVPKKNNFDCMTYENSTTLPVEWLGTDLNGSHLNHYVLGISAQSATTRSKFIKRDQTISNELRTLVLPSFQEFQEEKVNSISPLLVPAHQLDTLLQKSVHDGEELIVVPSKKRHQYLSKFHSTPVSCSSRRRKHPNNPELIKLKLNFKSNGVSSSDFNVTKENVVEENLRTKSPTNDCSKTIELSYEGVRFKTSTIAHKRCKCTRSKKLLGRTDVVTILGDESFNENTESVKTASHEYLHNTEDVTPCPSKSSFIEWTNKFSTCKDGLTSPGSNNHSEPTEYLQEEGKATVKTYTHTDVGGGQEEDLVMPTSASRRRLLSSKKKCTCSLLCTISDEKSNQRKATKKKAVKHNMETKFTLLKRFRTDQMCTFKSSKGTSKMKKVLTTSLSINEMGEKNSVTYGIKTGRYEMTSEFMNLEEYSDIDTSPRGSSPVLSAKISESTSKQNLMSNLLYIRNCTCLPVQITKRRHKHRMQELYKLAINNGWNQMVVSKPKSHTTERTKHLRTSKIKKNKNLETSKFTSTHWAIDADPLEKTTNCIHKDFLSSMISYANPRSFGFQAKTNSGPTKRWYKTHDILMFGKLRSGHRKILLNRSLRTPMDSNRPTLLEIQHTNVTNATYSKLTRLDSVTMKTLALARNAYHHHKKKYGVRIKASDQIKSSTVKLTERITVPQGLNFGNDIASVKIFIGRKNNQ